MRSRIVLAGIFLAVALMHAGTWSAHAAQFPGEGAGTARQEKRFAFEMRSQPWAKVFAWLSDQTGLPFLSDGAPAGEFTFQPAKANQTYTLTQIIDILNDALESSKHIIIRRDSALVLRAADEPIDPNLVPLLQPAELEGRGRTELVRVALPLKNLQAREVLAEVKKLMGPFSSATATSPNNLVLLDTSGNLKQVLKIVQDSPPGDSTETLAHVCLFVRATYAQKIIEELLTSRAQNKGGGRPAPQLVRISTDRRTNTVFVSGGPEHIAQAKAVLTRIDVAAQGSPRLALGPHLLKTYNVAAGNARAVAEALQRIFRGETDVEITALSNNQILVWADPEDQLAVARHLVELQPAPLATEVIVLSSLPPARTAETLRSMFGATRTGGGGVPFIEADPARNALIVKANKEQLDDIRSTLRSLGEGAPAGSARTFSVERGDAASLAEAMERLLREMRPNPVRVIMPDQKGGPAMKGKDKGGAPKKETSKAAGEITMTVVANKLIVACEDPQALALAQELVRMLTTTGDADGKYEVVKLRHANAADVAQVLDKAFNDPGKAAIERVRIVADSATNALLIKASPLDLLTVRRLLSSALDAEEADAAAPPQIRIIGPLKNAKAREVVNILRDIFGARPDDKSSAAAKGGPRFSVDERTNSIVVQCSPALQLEINALVTRLDEKL